jgi:hypothetical protein
VVERKLCWLRLIKNVRKFKDIMPFLPLDVVAEKDVADFGGWINVRMSEDAKSFLPPLILCCAYGC